MTSAGNNRTFPSWNETFGENGAPREVYRTLFDRLDSMPQPRVKALDERLEATMREMGVTFDVSRDRSWGQRPWYCDLMPQIFTPAEWKPLVAGIRQRLKAFDLFLRDVYSQKEILRSQQVPIQPVLGSPFFQHPAAGLPRPDNAFLHLSGISICRIPSGALVVKHHYFSNASGMSYMVQNRRALARVIPQAFQETSIHSIADAPTDILEMLRAHSRSSEPAVVMLSGGPASPAYSEHSFLARRMGIPLVQGGDLLVLDDAVYLKTVSGLQRVDVIYSRVSDQWLDPLAFRRDSLLGVPGLVHCIRKGTVAVVNAIGSQLADDRSLLPFAARIIRFYLGEQPILKGLPTYWLGDIDQREMVLADLADYTIRPLYGEKIFLGGDGCQPTAAEVDAVRRQILENASQFVAQPQACDAETACFQEGQRASRRQDHILFALRRTDGEYEVFPGALTRVSTAASPFTSSELGGGSKDTWVQVGFHTDSNQVDLRRASEPALPAQHVTSRVAEAFYWIGRYLERAYDLAGMVGVIESLELEELNPTERTHYRPVWNRILPMLEGAGTGTRRTLSSPAGRYRLTFDIDEPGSVVSTILSAARNAESVLEALSLEAWGVLGVLRSRFQQVRFRPQSPDENLTAASRKMCDLARQAIPQFFGTANCTMLADGGWKFCEIGQLLERAAVTANAACSIAGPLLQPLHAAAREHTVEIRLSAFLRMLNSRDVYRRVYQMRVEPDLLLDLLWKNPMAPRSVTRCLRGCAKLVQESDSTNSPATQRAVREIGALVDEVEGTDWESVMARPAEPGRKSALQARCDYLLQRVFSIHDTITDGFLNHQIHMRNQTQTQPPESGKSHAV